MNRLRHRMVIAAALVALLPAVPLSILVRSLLERSFAWPLSAEVDGALEAALEISREELRREKDALLRRAAGRSDDAAADERPVSRAVREAAGGVLGELPEEVAAWLRDGGAGAAPPGVPERVGGHLVVLLPGNGGVRVLARALPAGATERAARITDAVAMRRTLQAERGAVLRGYVLPFVVTYALLLLVAAWLGSLLARRIARPVEALAEAARRVGRGDLDTRVDVTASGEMGDLVRAFNGMVGELAAQQRELARLERMAAWRDLARTLAHEIKNPLTPIQLAIQQLADQTPPSGDRAYAALVSDCVEIVNEEVEALRRLVREFSEFARLPQPRPAAHDLADLLDDLGRLYGKRLACRAGAESLPARYDESELRRALINLIDNGMAACREAGRAERVELSASLDAAGGVVLRVSDDGDGVPPANRARIFEPDFSTKSEGMGLGLAIVDGIVRGHGGSIVLEEGGERGAAFTIRLPGPEHEGGGAPGTGGKS